MKALEARLLLWKKGSRRGIRVNYQHSGVSRDEDRNYNNNNTKEIYTEENIIHSKILKRNYNHLQQASSIPLVGWILKKGLKWDETGKLLDKILLGGILNERRFRAYM